MTNVDNLLALCSVSDVPDGGAIKAEAGGLVLAVFKLGDNFFVIDDACTHGPGSLSEGYIDGEVVECNFHNGMFNIRTGEVAGPPCIVPIRTYAVSIVDNQVCIDPNRRAQG